MMIEKKDLRAEKNLFFVRRESALCALVAKEREYYGRDLPSPAKPHQ